MIETLAAAALAQMGNKQLGEIQTGKNDNSAFGTASRGQAAFSTMGASEVARALFGNHKSQDQMGRDQNRAILQQSGLYDKDFNLTLSDGTKVNMGLDGSVKNYNVDFSKEGIDEIVASVNPIAYLVAGGDKKRASDLAGELTNAIANSKDPAAEAKRLYQQLGITPEQAAAAFKTQGLDEQTQRVFNASVSRYAPAPNAATTAGAGGGGNPYAGVSAAMKQSAADQKKAMQTANRSAILAKLLDKASATSAQPISFPTPGQRPSFLDKMRSIAPQPVAAAPQPAPQARSAQFSGTLNKILGG